MNHTANQPSGAGTDPMKFTAACVILGLSFLIGAPGNLLVIWTILRYVKKRSHTVVLILHLAVADLLVLITLPLWIYFLAQSLVVGPVFCKILVYIIRACMFSSIYIVTLISVERFLAICYPFGRMHWKTKNSMKTCLAVLWLLALLMGVPYTLTRKAEDKTRPCFSLEVTCVFQKIFLCLEILMGFIVPFIILSICYCQVLAKLKKMSFNTKQKSMVLIHAVVIAFIVCWLPYHIVNVAKFICKLITASEQCLPDSVVYSSGALSFINSSVNPVLYVFFARNLQGSLEESRLVRLFQEMVTSTSKPEDVVVQQESGKRAANTQEEPVSDCVETTESTKQGIYSSAPN